MSDVIADKLHSIIRDRVSSLQAYSKRPEAKKGYIEKQNSHIGELVGIHNELIEMTPSDISTEMKRHLEEMQIRDKQVNGLIIYYRTNPDKFIPAYLDFNLYDR